MSRIWLELTNNIMRQHEIRQMFGDNIKTLRRNRGLNQDQYAELLSVRRSNIGSWEEHRATPSLETMFLIGKLEGLTIEQLATKRVKDKQNVLAVR